MNEIKTIPLVNYIETLGGDARVAEEFQKEFDTCPSPEHMPKSAYVNERYVASCRDHCEQNLCSVKL